MGRAGLAAFDKSRSTQVQFFNAYVLCQFGAGPLVAIEACIEYIGIVRDLQSTPRILFDHQQTQSEFIAQQHDSFEDLVDNARATPAEGSSSKRIFGPLTNARARATI